MEIKANTVYDVGKMMEYNALALRRKLAMLVITALIFVAGVTVTIVGIVTQESKLQFIIFLVLFAVFAAAEVLLYTVYPRVLYKKMLDGGIEASYTLDDEGIHAELNRAGTPEKTDSPWSGVTQLIEGSTCFFAGIGTSTVYVIAKNGFTQGAADDARALFSEKLPAKVYRRK